MADLRIPYTPNGKQAEFHAAGEKYRLLLGAAGSGKTVALCVEDFQLAMEVPGSLGVVFRKTYPALRDTTKQTYLDMLQAMRLVHPDGREEPAWPYLVANEIKSEGREEVEYANGSRTLFRCLDDYRKLGSTAFDRISVDEALEVEEREFKTLIARLRGTKGPRRLACATNPPDEDHFLYQFFEVEKDGTRRVIHSSTYDNRANLPADYIAELEKYPPQWRQKFLHGQWGFLADGKPVFQEWIESEHVDDLRPILGAPILRGWDFGFRHPACVWLQIVPTGHVHWLHELQGTDEELRSFAARVQDETARLFPKHEIEDYADIAGTQKNDRGPTAVQVLQRDFNIWPNCRKFGLHFTLERIRYLLRERSGGVPLLRVNRSCRLSRKAFGGGYYINPTTQEPQKNTLYDNLMDAGRYPIAATFSRVGEPGTQVTKLAERRAFRVAV